MAILCEARLGGISAGLNFIERNPHLFEDSYPLPTWVFTILTPPVSVRSKDRALVRAMAGNRPSLYGRHSVRLITDEVAVREGAKNLLIK